MSELTSNAAAPGAPAAGLQAGAPPIDRARAAELGAFARFLKATELDTRMLGMVGALLVIWIGFHLVTAVRSGSGPLEFSQGFLTPRNLWNLSVQFASIAVMATGMVLVIVTRNIDLSIGSLLGFVGMVMGVLQAWFLTPKLGDSSLVWILTLLAGLALGSFVGALQGFVVAYLGVPAFIVTLGGLLVWRGAAWWVATGQTVPLTDGTFKLIGGGAEGAVGAAASWALAAAGCLVVVLTALNARRQRRRFRFPLKPVWAEVLTAGAACLALLCATAVINSYTLPLALARRYAEAHGITPPPEGLSISFGYAIPVLIAVAVGIAMNFVATRTRFGRYVFAIGGNPEAAELAGINTRRVTVLVFTLMGFLAAISAAISTARLTSATNAQGTLDELYTIAAAVIGGTSLAGGSGTVAGAMLGALIMQSLQSGMGLLNVETTLQNIVIGVVLVIAVWGDTVYRRHVG